MNIINTNGSVGNKYVSTLEHIIPVQSNISQNRDGCKQRLRWNVFFKIIFF